MIINEQKIGDEIVRVNYSKYKEIDMKKNNKSENSVQFNECIVTSDKQHRFSNMSTEKVQNLSHVLDFRGNNELNSLAIFKEVSSVSKPKKVKFT